MRANAQMLLSLGLLDRKPYALFMPTAPASRISLLTPARPGLFTIVATSLTAVPCVLHAVAPRRVACEFPGGIVLRSLYSQKIIIDLFTTDKKNQK
jgi:hypothetical protein